MRAKEFTLFEGVGLARRKPGETFENPQGDIVTFKELTFFPNVGKYGTPEERDQAIAQATAGKNVHWTNTPNSASLAFGIATFTTDEGKKEYYLGRYFKEIKANRNDNDFPHSAIPGGFKFSSKAGAKENAGYKASQILKKFKDNTPQEVADQIIEKFGQGSDEATAVDIFMKASNFPVRVPKGAMNFDAFKIYFCELLQPIALVKGMSISGNAQDAVDIFFGQGASLQDCRITFNDSAGGALSDSVLVSPDKKELKISTKDAVGGGAKASAQNFFKIIEELERAGKKEIIDRHRDVVKILEAFKGNEMKPDQDGKIRYDGRAHFSGPIGIAKLAKMINDEEAQQILALKGMDLGDNPIGKNILSKKLENWYSEYLEKWKKPVVPLHTMMLILATKVAKYVNEETNFSSSASDILNHSALIQVYNDVVPSDKDFIIRGMRAVYPSNAVTGVRLTTEKAYWTTGAQGNMTFEILYNNEVPSGAESFSEPADAPTVQQPAQAPSATPAPVAPAAPVATKPAITPQPPKSIQNLQKSPATQHKMGQEPEIEPEDDELDQVKKNAGLEPVK